MINEWFESRPSLPPRERGLQFPAPFPFHYIGETEGTGLSRFIGTVALKLW